MVLSNKKLKQKLRAEIAISLTSSATRPVDYALANSDPDSQTQSLKQLLDSVTQKPRLSKREKKRRVDKNTSIEAEEEERKNNDVVGGENGEKKKKKKKRKREEGESGGVKEPKKANTNNNNNKQKQKKKKKKKKKKKNEEADNKGSGDGGDVGNQELNNVSTKVYVGGIPYTSTENDIKTYFESSGCGTINEIDCMTFPDSGRFRGIAIITFRVTFYITCCLHSNFGYLCLYEHIAIWI